MCCCIPPYNDLRPGPTGPTDDKAFVVRVWAGLATVAVTLSLALAGAIWLAARLA